MPAALSTVGRVMANKRKLHLKALNNPRGLRFEEFIALIEAFGFVFRRQAGSHRIYGRAEIAERVNVQPLPDGKAKTAQGREFLKRIERLGLDLEEHAP